MLAADTSDQAICKKLKPKLAPRLIRSMFTLVTPRYPLRNITSNGFGATRPLWCFLLFNSIFDFLDVAKACTWYRPYTHPANLFSKPCPCNNIRDLPEIKIPKRTLIKKQDGHNSMIWELWSSRSLNNQLRLIEQKKVIQQNWSPRSCSKQLGLIEQKKGDPAAVCPGTEHVRTKRKEEQLGLSNYNDTIRMTLTRIYRQGARKVGSTSSAGRTLVIVTSEHPDLISS